MKQYTTPDQTAKLIELGFEKPKAIIDVWAHETEIDMEYEYEYAYSIGELIEMLPEEITIDVFTHDRVISKNEVSYYSWILEVYFHIFDNNDELIDNMQHTQLMLHEKQ